MFHVLEPQGLSEHEVKTEPNVLHMVSDKRRLWNEVELPGLDDEAPQMCDLKWSTYRLERLAVAMLE